MAMYYMISVGKNVHDVALNLTDRTGPPAVFALLISVVLSAFYYYRYKAASTLIFVSIVIIFVSSYIWFVGLNLTT